MRRVVALLMLLVLVPFAAPSAVAQQEDEVRFDYKLEDPAEDVVLIAANGSERWSAKPEADLRAYQSAVEGDTLVQTLTFAATPPAKDLRVELTLTLSATGSQPLPVTLSFTDAKAATASTQSQNATANMSGSTMVVRMPMAKLADATCFAPRVKVVYDPEGDPVTSTDAGRQGWEDQFFLRANRCVSSFGGTPVLPIEDGMDGTCPAPSVPSGVSVTGSWDDPTGDVRNARQMGQSSVAYPEADITRLTSTLEGNEVVVRMTVAQYPDERDAPLASVDFALEGKTEEFDFEGKDTLSIGFSHPDHEAFGTLSDVQGEEATRQSFYTRGARDGNTFVARFCASIIPDYARCWAPLASITYNVDDRPYDEIEFAWNEGPCAGKTGGSGSTGGSAGGDDGEAPPSEDGAEGETPGEDEGAEGGAGQAGTPGFGVVALVGAVLVALAITRRRA